jgi:hypothetical protein
MTAKCNVEYTDTFGGEANYCWVNRYEFDPDGMSDLAIVRKAKLLAGLNGVRGIMQACGDMFEFRPYRCATVLFITFDC